MNVPTPCPLFLQTSPNCRSTAIAKLRPRDGVVADVVDFERTVIAVGQDHVGGAVSANRSVGDREAARFSLRWNSVKLIAGEANLVRPLARNSLARNGARSICACGPPVAAPTVKLAQHALYRRARLNQWNAGFRRWSVLDQVMFTM